MAHEIRSFEEKDLEDAAHLINNFWGLNVEFEPSIELKENAFEKIKEDLREHTGREDQLILVAKSESGQNLTGIIRVELKRGKFHGPERWGNVVEFYVLPRARRKAVAKGLLDAALDKLKQKGIQMITAEFPTQNVPAASFYEKNGFRPLQTVFVKDLT
jgi:ribosomal protein S18 acetylase RimI-like enzyme